MGSQPNTFTRAILWVAHPKLLWQRAGGMFVLERQMAKSEVVRRCSMSLCAQKLP